MNKQISVDICKAQTSGYDATFVMSASSPDRVNDTIAPAAYKSAIGGKLIALWQHKQDSPIGFWENLRQEGDKLIGDLRVASTNLGKMVKQLIADGVPVGASIGFTGEGKRNEKGGVHFTSLKLLECSVVSIPAHPRAMQIAKSFDLEEFIDSDQSSVEVDDNSASGVCIESTIERAKAATLKAQKSIRLKGL